MEKTLKHLDLDCEQTYIYQLHLWYGRIASKLFEVLPKAKNLVHLSIRIDSRIIDGIFFADHWNEIAINCNQLKSLKLSLDCYEVPLIDDQMLSVLKQFKRLKRLEFEFNYKMFKGSNIYFRPIKDFKGLEGLTHLSIIYNDFYDYMLGDFEETKLTDIDIILPKLKYLKIEFLPFDASECTGQVLSRISTLETVELEIENPEIIPVIETQLIQNCKHFKKFNNLNEY